MPKVVIKAKPGIKDSGKRISKSHEFKVNMYVSLSDKHRGLTWEQMQERIAELIKQEWPDALVTPMGGHILIDGRACYPHDFDYTTMDRKPGTHPPLYTLSDAEQREVQVLQRIERERKNPNRLARNPEHLLTSRETDMLNKIRGRKPSIEVRVGSKDPAKPVASASIRRNGKDIHAQSTDLVEWTEKDADNEELAEKETAKLLRKIPAKKTAAKKIVVKRR